MAINARKLSASALLSAACTVPLTGQILAQEGAITGEVIDGGGRPIWRASLSLSAAGATTQRTMTDREGKFLFKQVSSGRYRITVSAAGYYEEENARDRADSYRAGETVTIRLSKGGVITGRVTNQSGEPLVGLKVRAFRVRDEKGAPVKSRESYDWESDDRGMYRLFGLKPGAYLVAAEDNKLGFYLPSPYRFNTTNWYPSGVRETSVEVPVAALSVTENINILYRAQRGYSISGTVAVKSGGAPGTFSTVNLIDRQSGLLLQSTSTSGQQSGFALYGAADGEYEIEAEAPGQPGQSRMISPRQRVKVNGGDVGGLQLSLSSLGLIRGKILVEPPNEGSCCKPFALSELFLEAAKESREGMDQRFTHAETVPDLQGAFILLNLVIGQYRLNLNGLGDHWYIKQLSGALDDSGLAPVGVAGRSPEVIITLAPGAATLTGKTTMKSQVYLVPTGQPGRLKVTQVRVTRAQADGVFTIRHLAPGSYRIFSRVMRGNEEEKGISVEELPRLKKEAEAKGLLVELKSCQQLTGVKLP